MQSLTPTLINVQPPLWIRYSELEIFADSKAAKHLSYFCGRVSLHVGQHQMQAAIDWELRKENEAQNITQINDFDFQQACWEWSGMHFVCNNYLSSSYIKRIQELLTVDVLLSSKL